MFPQNKHVFLLQFANCHIFVNISSFYAKTHPSFNQRSRLFISMSILACILGFLKWIYLFEKQNDRERERWREWCNPSGHSLSKCLWLLDPSQATAKSQESQCSLTQVLDLKQSGNHIAPKSLTRNLARKGTWLQCGVRILTWNEGIQSDGLIYSATKFSWGFFKWEKKIEFLEEKHLLRIRQE